MEVMDMLVPIASETLVAGGNFPAIEGIEWIPVSRDRAPPFAASKFTPEWDTELLALTA